MRKALEENASARIIDRKKEKSGIEVRKESNIGTGKASKVKKKKQNKTIKHWGQEPELLLGSLSLSPLIICLACLSETFCSIWLMPNYPCACSVDTCVNWRGLRLPQMMGEAAEAEEQRDTQNQENYFSQGTGKDKHCEVSLRPYPSI